MCVRAARHQHHHYLYLYTHTYVVAVLRVLNKLFIVNGCFFAFLLLLFTDVRPRHSPPPSTHRDCTTRQDNTYDQESATLQQNDTGQKGEKARCQKDKERQEGKTNASPRNAPDFLFKNLDLKKVVDSLLLINYIYKNGAIFLPYLLSHLHVLLRLRD